MGKTLRRRADAQSHRVLPFSCWTIRTQKIGPVEIELISSDEHHASLEMTASYRNLFAHSAERDAAGSRARGRLRGAALARIQRGHRIGQAAVLCGRRMARTPIFWCWPRARAINCVPETRALQRERTGNDQGYFVPQTADAITIKFLPHFEGYIWSFPRCDHLVSGNLRKHGGTHQPGVARASENVRG